MTLTLCEGHPIGCTLNLVPNGRKNHSTIRHAGDLKKCENCLRKSVESAQTKKMHAHKSCADNDSNCANKKMPAHACNHLGLLSLGPFGHMGQLGTRFEIYLQLSLSFETGP